MPGEIVAVAGRRAEDGRWLATAIRRVTLADGSFDIYGRVDGLEPLVVGGIRLVTADWTHIDQGLEAGSLVHAEGRILDDGTWLAERITLLDPAGAQPFEFIGRVEAVEPLVVAGITLLVDEHTYLEAGIAAGDRVRVRGEILPGGQWLARDVRRLDSALGCLDLRSVVVRVDGSQVVLLDGQVINLEGVIVEGQLNPATVIVIHGCVSADGQFTIITIIVIYQLDDLPPMTPTPAATPVASPPAGDKVTLCHRPPGNPRNAHTITVGAAAVPAHLAHGDTLGACGP
jgi:hypothetical protein